MDAGDQQELCSSDPIMQVAVWTGLMSLEIKQNL